MKKDLKNHKKLLRFSKETLRDLSLCQLTEVVGGSNACISGTGNLPTACTICQN